MHVQNLAQLVPRLVRDHSLALQGLQSSRHRVAPRCWKHHYELWTTVRGQGAGPVASSEGLTQGVRQRSKGLVQHEPHLGP